VEGSTAGSRCGLAVPNDRYQCRDIKELIMQFLKKMETENARFLKVTLDAYRDELEAQLRKTAH
jgi:hypothetical protein